MPYLSINTEGRSSFRRSLEGRAILGRSLDCDIHVGDHRLSRQHCRFERTPSGDWLVTDLGSTNGTIISDERISVHKLEDGEVINAGRTRIVFHARSAPPARPEEPTRSIAPGDSQIASASPGETMMDSKFRIPRIDPASANVSKPKERREKRERQKPLPFQRPPAKPIVPPGARQGHDIGFFRSIWRRMFRR